MPTAPVIPAPYGVVEGNTDLLPPTASHGLDCEIVSIQLAGHQRFFQWTTRSPSALAETATCAGDGALAQCDDGRRGERLM